MNPDPHCPEELKEVENWLDAEAGASVPRAASRERVDRITERARFEQSLKILTNFSCDRLPSVFLSLLAILFGGRPSGHDTDYRP
jgi:hypothetical protein